MLPSAFHSSEFTGSWIDDEGRTLLVELRGLDLVVCVMRSVRGAAFERRLPSAVRPALTIDMPARVEMGEMRKLLRVEVGAPDLGPTYDLEHDGWDSLRPAVSRGLYDDFDDDFGVPWAFPLAIYRRARHDEIDEIERRTLPPVELSVPRVTPRLPSSPNAIALGPDGRHLATAHGFVEGSSSAWSNDWQRVVESVTRVWAVESGELLLSDRHASRVLEVAFLDQGRVVSRSCGHVLEEPRGVKTYVARTSTIDLAAGTSDESTQDEARALARSIPFEARGELRSEDGSVVATWEDEVVRLRHSRGETVLCFERPPD